MKFTLLFLSFLLSLNVINAQSGCTNMAACNYDPGAVVDDGTCAFVVDCSGICGGFFVQDACGNCFDPNGQNGSQQFNFSGTVQFWTVPDGVTLITIEAEGGEGGRNGNNTAQGGLGAYARGDFFVTPGEVIKIIVGGEGGDGQGSIAGGGGGGGSFVIRNANNTPLLIAGGGGGASYTNPGLTNGEGGRITLLGGAGGYFQVGLAQGGHTDNGGGGGTGSGGGGWTGNGVSNNWCSGGIAGGGAGGAGVYSNAGGYGGGGGSMHGGGGGGGYTGGSGGTYTVGAGGGGSYNDGANPVLTANANSGPGSVTISYNAIPECAAGCTDPAACNFDPAAEVNDGSCHYVFGCSDPLACNFNPNACEDGSCQYGGCNDPAACNFDPNALCGDNSCVYNVDCAGNCGGNYVQDECGNCYDPNGVNDVIEFNYTGTNQFWIVPANVNDVTIEVWGAEGGRNGVNTAQGGRGAYAKGDFSVNPGEQIKLIVGGEGGDGVGGIAGGGGGGGSFAIRTAGNIPLIIAGGGGGASYTNPGLTNGEGGRTTETGGAGGYNQVGLTQGGYTDNGGGGGTGSGGGGWIGNGTSNNWCSGGIGGGGAGGAGVYSNQGGFGGGGGSMHGGGGGGGYTGGSGGTYTIGAGGGGSYNTGQNTEMIANNNSGNGKIIISFNGVPDCVPGCTNPLADNYNPDATNDDGSCVIFGCTNPQAVNYNPDATNDDGSCIVFGCTYAQAVNYNPDAISDDGSCIFNCGDSAGCTDPSACNYQPSATIDNGSCTYPAPLRDCQGYCLNDADNDGVCDEVEILGCTDWNASNFNPSATEDDGTCLASCEADLNHDGLINTSDLLEMLGEFGTICQ
jgi:hypothetical protein